MKLSEKPMIVLCATFFVTYLSLCTPMFAQENSCYIHAPPRQDIWVVVFELGFDGTKGKILWEGKLKADEKKLIKTESGQFKYKYKTDPDQPYRGDKVAFCTNQGIVTIY